MSRGLVEPLLASKDELREITNSPDKFDKADMRFSTSASPR
jgi:hypothetical protein